MKNIGMKKNINEQREGIWGESLKSLKSLMQIFAESANSANSAKQIFAIFATFATFAMQIFGNLVKLVKLVMQIFAKGEYSAVRAMSVQQPTNIQRISNLSLTVRPTYNRFTTNSVLSRLCLVSLILISLGVGDAWGETCYLFQHLDEENVKTKNGNTAIYTTPDLGNVDGIDTIRFEYKMNSDWAKKMKVRYSTDGINFADFSGSDKKSMDNKWRGRTGDFGNKNEDVYVLVPESLRTSIKKVQFAVYEGSIGEYTYYVRRVQISRCPTIKINNAASQSSTFSQTAVGDSKNLTFTISTWNINTTPIVTRTTGSTFFSAELSSPTDDCPKTRTLTITYSPTSEAYADHDPANHSASFTISAGGKTATLNVTGTAREIADVIYTWHRSAPYYVGEVIDLSEVWTSSNVEETPVYSITSFTDPTGTNNGGAKAPKIEDGHYLHLNQACDVTLAVHQDAMTGYAEGNDTKTITVNKNTPTFTWNTSANYYYNTTISPFVTKTSGGSYSVTSNNEQVASTSGDNVIIYNKPGTAIIRVLHPETYYWNEYDHSESITPGWKTDTVSFSLTNDNHNMYEPVSAFSTDAKWEDSQVGYTFGNSDISKKKANYAIIRFTGIPDSLFFDKTLDKVVVLPQDRDCYVYESADGTDWTVAWFNNAEEAETNGNKVKLLSTTRYLKFYYDGTIYAHYKNIRVTRRKHFKTDKSSLNFATNQLNSSPEAQTFKFYHASAGYITSVTSNDAHFTVTPSSVITGGEICDSAVITVNYLTTEAGSHSGRITITDNIGNSTYVTVTGVTQDKLATHLVYLGESSYNVDHANIAATTLFEVRDANNALVASPVITLSSNATSVIGTVSENTAIDFLCGGSATITASYAGDETYAASVLPQVITVNKIADTIVWSNVEEDDKIHVWAESDIPSSIASANEAIDSYTSGNSANLRVSGSKGSFALRARRPGEVTLTAHSEGSCTYNTAENTKTIVVEPCTHNIVWEQEQNLAGLSTEEDGSINLRITLEAYAVDSANQPTGRTITYTLPDNTSFASIENDNELVLTGTGSVILTASTAAGDTIYAQAQASKLVRVREYGTACGSEIVDKDQHAVGWYDNNDGKQYGNITPLPPIDKIYVRVGKYAGGATQTLYFYGYNASGAETTLASYGAGNLSTDGEDKVIENISEDICRIKIKAGGTISKWYSDLRITQKSYLRTNKASISNDHVFVYDSIRDTIRVSYSDKPLLQYRYTGSHLSLSPTSTVRNDCGDYGYYDFVLSGTYTRMGDFRDTIYITTTALDTLRIPIYHRVSTGGILYFNEADGEWGETTKWTNDMLPHRENDVIISKNVTISGEVAAYSVTIASGASVTIQPGAGLTVGAGGISGASTGKLKLEAGTEGVTKGQTGYLRISPDYTGEMPDATVEMFTIGYYDRVNAGENVAAWQYVGSPLAAEDVLASTVYTNSWIYSWQEKTNSWKNNRKTLRFTPFKGYATTQYSNSAGTKLNYNGQLVAPGRYEVPLDYSGADYGANMVANSFAAPIDITKFTQADFVNMERTIYIFNTGTRNQAESKSGSNGSAAGQFFAISIGTISDMSKQFEDDPSLPTTIAPMQGFSVNAQSKGAKLILDYDRLVWNADYSAHQPKPLRAPKRSESEDEQPITGAMKITLSADGWSDNVYFLESEKYDVAFEDGFDAHKMESGTLNIFAVEDEDKLAIDATNSIIGTRVGVRTGEETAYTMTFNYIKGDYVLWDIDAEEQVAISEGQTYTFFAEPNSEITSRFVIIEADEADAPSVTTGVEDVQGEQGTKVHKFVKDDKLFILKNGVLYDATGMRVSRLANGSQMN